MWRHFRGACGTMRLESVRKNGMKSSDRGVYAIANLLMCLLIELGHSGVCSYSVCVKTSGICIQKAQPKPVRCEMIPLIET